MNGILYSPVSSSSRCVPAICASLFFKANNPPIEPAWADESESFGYFFFSEFDRRSRALSWLPMHTIVFSISFFVLSSSTSTSEPAPIPSDIAGILTKPSARTSDIKTPAPRETGAAMNLSPTFPILTLRNSSCPSVDAACLERTACKISGGAISIPCHL